MDRIGPRGLYKLFVPYAGTCIPWPLARETTLLHLWRGPWQIRSQGFSGLGASCARGQYLMAWCYRFTRSPFALKDLFLLVFDPYSLPILRARSTITYSFIKVPVSTSLNFTVYQAHRVTKKQVGLSSLSNCIGVCAKVQRDIQRQQLTHDYAWWGSPYHRLLVPGSKCGCTPGAPVFSKRTTFNPPLDPHYR